MEVVNALREDMEKSRKECFSWVDDDFEQQAAVVYKDLGSPKLTMHSGWIIFYQMCARITESRSHPNED